MERKKVVKDVKKIIGEIMEIPCEDIKESDNLMSDLKLESLDIVGLVSAFEDKYKIEIEDQDIKLLQTVKDIVDYIINNV